MKIAVCDDEKLFRDEVIHALYDFFGRLEFDCAAYGDGAQLLADYGRGVAFDAVILDIEMPVTDGMWTAGELRRDGYGGPILFLTSHTELAMDGYEVSAFRFLSKPLNSKKLNKALHDLRTELKEKRRIAVRSGGEEVVLLLDDIQYVEAMNNSIAIVTTGGEYAVRRKISDIEKELGDGFFRIHRGYLVNLAHVKRYHGTGVTVTGDITLPVSRGLANEFKRKLFLFVENSAR